MTTNPPIITIAQPLINSLACPAYIKDATGCFRLYNTAFGAWVNMDDTTAIQHKRAHDIVWLHTHEYWSKEIAIHLHMLEQNFIETASYNAEETYQYSCTNDMEVTIKAIYVEQQCYLLTIVGKANTDHSLTTRIQHLHETLLEKEKHTAQTLQSLGTYEQLARRCISNIIGSCDLLKDSSLTTQQRTYCDYIEQSATDLLQHTIQLALEEPPASIPIAGSSLHQDIPLPQTFDASILLVEDSPMNQMVSHTILRKLGCRVDVATDGIEAIQKAAFNEYDIIFMDCDMPDIDGYDATRELRARESTSDSSQRTIIAMTANSMEGDKKRCLDAGMDDYIAKPVNKQLIAAMLNQWIPHRAKH